MGAEADGMRVGSRAVGARVGGRDGQHEGWVDICSNVVHLVQPQHNAYNICLLLQENALLVAKDKK